jgi:hypothetical protein
MPEWRGPARAWPSGSAPGKKAELCSSFGDLEGCARFEWLGEHGQQVKQKLKECRRLSQEEYIRKMKSSRER